MWGLGFRVLWLVVLGSRLSSYRGLVLNVIRAIMDCAFPGRF